MALTDLKKNSTRSNKSEFTVDEFIADAENYAMGIPQIVSVRKVAEDDNTPIISQGPMRHATFTLSQEAIDTLNKLSKESGLPKSKLIRQLILSMNEQELRSVLKTSKPVVIKKVE
jgi:hypothetical protein